MKRKVIQIAHSTQLISLPRKWALEHGITKGDELDIQEKGDRLIISTDRIPETQTPIELHIKSLEPMTVRVIHAMYKRGIDEIKVNFDKPSELELIQSALGKETVGYEIVEQNRTSCVIKNVSGDLEDFDPILRRTFLLLITLADEGLIALKNRNSQDMKNVLPLEESNNRFTTTCRRFLNKRTSEELVGPLYCIIEALEKIADQYKYVYSYLTSLDLNKAKILPSSIKIFESVNTILKLFYNTFYKLDKDKISEIGRLRKEVVKEWYSVIANHKKYNSADLAIISNMLVIAQQVFNITGPLLALKGQSFG